MGKYLFIFVLLGLTDTIIAQNAERQRYAILMATMLRGGSKGVRFETMPNTLMDQNGKPVKSMGQKNGDGSTSFTCVDILGKQRQNGEEYSRPNGHFVYKCNDGIEEVIACVGTKRTNGAHISVGQNLDVNGFWHKCQGHENGTVVYTEENSCRDAEGKEIRKGDEFSVANLRFVCGDGHFEVAGCSYKNANGVSSSLAAGEQREEGKLVHKCTEKDGNLQYEAVGHGCSKRGKDYAEGQEFKENHLKYKCTSGVVDITGCYVNEQKDLSVGSDFAENGVIHRCYRLGGTIEYSENPCSGASCSPPPVDSGPDDVPSLGRGLISPGVSSFSVVSSGTPPQGIQLDLDKILMGRQG